MSAAKAFLAGFAATLIFHQPALWILNAAGVIDRAPYALDPTKPFGIPSVISLALWGGVWGILLWLVVRGDLKGTTYWLIAVVFGAIAPTLVAWFVAAPLKGQPIGGGWKTSAIATAVIINGAWGLGTAVFLKLFRTRR